MLAPHRKGAPQAAQRFSGGFGSKRAHRFADEAHLPRERTAAVADREVHAQPHALGEAEAAVEPLGHEAGDVLAGEHHFFPNQFMFRHSRSAMRAR